MDYKSALEYLFARSGYDRGFISNPFAGDATAALGLQRTRALLERLGRPDRKYKIVHVAGTKGKGSTCAMLESVVRHAGLRSGMYVTPHLHSFRERIQISGCPIPEDDFGALLEEVSKAVEHIENTRPEFGSATAFEITTALALFAFARFDVDVAIVEVGLGGRLDATNVVRPEVSVITSISFDHTAILGNTLAEIASEKAGIIKPRAPIVVAAQQSTARDRIQKIADEREAPLYQSNRDWSVRYSTGQTKLSGPWGTLGPLQLGLRGAHQAENAGIALMACWLLDRSTVSDHDTVTGALETVDWPGRFELLAASPLTIADGAHNVDSIRRLISTLEESYPDRPVIIILGVSRDKDIAGMLRVLQGNVTKVIAVQSTNARAATSDSIIAASKALHINAASAESTGQAINQARQITSDNGVICITGSLYVVAEAREAFGLATVPAYERALFNT